MVQNELSLISKLNEWSLNLAIHFLWGEGGSHDVDIILGGVVTSWWCLITKGEDGVKNLGKGDYIILTM